MKTQIMNCTSDSPMPDDRDQMGQHWYHHGSKPKEPDGDIFICPNCSHEFKVFRGRKISAAEAIAQVQEMKQRGLRFPEGEEPC